MTSQLQCSAGSLTCVERRSDAGPLLDKLGGLPLALALAGAYISIASLTAEEYIAHYNETWDRLMASQDLTPLQEYAERSVLTTWKISYEQVRVVNKEAAVMLDQWAFLNPGDMSYTLIETYNDKVESREEDEALARDKLSFRNAVGVLARYSLISNMEDTGRFSIHAVVHDWSLYNLFDDEYRERLCVRAIRMVAESVPSSQDADSLQAAQWLLSHARMAARRHAKMNEVAGLHLELHKLACFMSEWESSQEVESLYVRALRGYEETLGAKHTSTLDTVNNLGNLYYNQGKTKKAEEMYVRALGGYEEAWRVKYAPTLSTINNLGILYADQGKMKKAEEMYVRALRGLEEALGAKHMLTLDPVHNLGILYADQGKRKEAEEMLMRALRGYEEALGANHTSTLDTVNSLGHLYADQGKMKEAEEMYLRSFRGCQEAWRAKHKSTLDSIHCLGFLYCKQGKMKEAEAMLVQALRGYEEALGAKHTSTLLVVNNLGMLYAGQGKLKEAEEMLLRALRGYEDAWGAKHTSTLDIVYNLGILFNHQDEVEKAKFMYERAAEGYEDVEVNRDAQIAFIRNQLPTLVARDGNTDGPCQVDGQRPLISSTGMAIQASRAPACDLAETRSAASEAPVRPRKRDFLLRVLNR